MEKTDGFNYMSLSNFLESDVRKDMKEFGMNKSDLKHLLSKWSFNFNPPSTFCRS